MAFKLVLLLTVLFLPLDLCLVKEWVHTYSLNDPKQWEPEKSPCGNDKLIFPKTMKVILNIQEEISASEIILPETGYFYFHEGGRLSLGGNSENSSCKGEVLQFKNILVYSWLGIDSWKITSFTEEETKSGEGGLAIPHRDRMPCYNDEVVLPKHRKFIVRMPPNYIRIKRIRWGEDYWDFIVEQVALKMMMTPENYLMSDNRLTIETNEAEKSNSVEICQEDVSASEVCDEVICPRPLCINPLKPVMDCCHICGGLITAEVNEDFDIENFRKIIANYIVTELEDEKSPIWWWIGALGKNDEGKYHIQIIIMDKKQYRGVSAAFVEEFEMFINQRRDLQLKVVSTLKSGVSLADIGSFGGIWLVLTTLLGVLLFLSGFILYYYGPNSATGVSRPFDFARFENRSREGSLAFGILPQPLNKFFENPLYSSTRKPKEELEVKEVPLNENDEEESEEVDLKLETSFKD